MPLQRPPTSRGTTAPPTAAAHRRMQQGALTPDSANLLERDRLQRDRLQRYIGGDI